MKMKMQMQSGGEFADHELVKLASKVVDGVSRPPSTPFEKILVLYDKMKGVKNERKLTAKEQRIFDRVDAVVQQEFDAMFRRAEPMLKSIEKRPGSQSGGKLSFMKQDIEFSQGLGFAKGPAETGKNQQAPAAPADTEGVNPGENQQAPAQTKSTADPEGAKPEENQPKQEASTEEKPESAPADPTAAANPGTVAAAAAAAQSSAASAASTAPAETQQPPAPQAVAESGKGGGTFFMNTNRFIAVLWQSLKGIWDWVKSFFVGTMDDKMKEFMKFFSPERLMAMIGKTAKDIEKVDSEVKDSIQNLQTTVVSGVSGAASASIDMVLNAFSMMPAFGTVLLVWRMFQNLLVIMGATLSVQAGKDELTGKFYKEGVKNPGAADAAAKKGEATKPGTGGDGELKPGSTVTEPAPPAAEGQGQAQAQPAASTIAEKPAENPAAQGQGQPAEKPAATAAEPVKNPAAQEEGPGQTANVGGGGRAGRRRVSSSMTKKINLETRRFKKSLKRYLHLRVPRFMPGGGGGGGGGSSAFKSGYAAL